MDDKHTINFKVDTAFAKDEDPCKANLFSDSSKVIQFNFTLNTLSGLSTLYSGVLENFVFLNESLFIVTYSYSSASEKTIIDSIIWKININPNAISNKVTGT